ncbi:multidrug and toxin extrusion protein 2-like [Pelodytes ibericus]
MNGLEGQSTGEQQSKESSPLKGKSSWLPRCVRRLLPNGFGEELKIQLLLAGPIFLSQIMIYFVTTISTVFCGHLGKIQLDAATLAFAIIVITGTSVGAGFSSVCDTLISQAYGSKNMKRMGTILQRAILMLLLFCFPCWAIFINVEGLLLLFRQNPEICRLTQKYILIFIPALPAMFMYQLQMRYLQNQSIIWPPVFIAFGINVLNIILNAIFLYGFKMGLVGSALANVLSQISMCVFLFLYIYLKKLHVETWPGWSKDCLQEWGPFVNLAIPCMLMICVEWSSFQIGGFLAGLISEVELGGQSLMLEFSSIAYMVPMGYSVAASVRVGSALGAGDIDQAQLATKVSIICTGFSAVLLGSLVVGLKDHVPYIFTTDRNIIHLVSQLLMIFAPFHMIDAVNCSCGGILRGSGKQKVGAVLATVGNYIIGLPIGISLMFAAKLGAKGLWIGMLASVGFQIIIFVIFVLRLNWQNASDEAKFRAGVKHKPEKEPGLSNLSLIYITGDIQLNDVEHSVEDHSIPGQIVLPDIASDDKYTSQLVQQEDSGIEATNIVGEVLSVKQLIIRRGLALTLAITSLVIGVIVKLLTVNR